MISQLLWPIILQLTGIAVIIAEFVLPSAGILSVLSVGIFGFSLYLVFTNVSVSTGLVFVIFDIMLIPVVLFIGIKFLAASPATLKTALSSKDGTVSQPPEWIELQNKQGEAITDLHPTGTVLIDGRRHDVVSRGEYINKGSPVVVITIDSNRIVVKKTDAE